MKSYFEHPFHSEINKQAMLFLLIGLISTIINYFLFFVFYVFLSINFLISAAAGFLAGMIFGFFYNMEYTFRSKREIRKSLPVYFGVYLFSLSLNIFFLNFFVKNFNTNVLLTNFFLLIFTTFINFFGIKIFAFKNTRW